MRAYLVSAHSRLILPQKSMKILVAIASYGTSNDRYLARVVAEYRSMPFDTNIVVVSNEMKAVPPDVRLVVGLPSRNPWSLPFAHKQILADGLSEYDLFIYSEDDILITERNIQAFLRLSASLPEDEIPGFLRFEEGPSGAKNYPDFHVHFRWAPGSVRQRGTHTLAFFTNEHAACYVLTRHQLQRAINSGGFLVQPHEGDYDLACTAATDPYTQCGVRKMICVSDLDDFLVHHLPNKYVGKVGIEQREFLCYRDALFAAGADSSAELFRTETKLRGHWYSKDYYEPVREDLVSLVPNAARSVLSVGCGWGEIEERLAKSGRRVVALPLDPVMSAWARSKGVDVVNGSLTEAARKIEYERFDCILISNVLHLVESPAKLLSSFLPILTEHSAIVTSVPRIPRAKLIWRKVLRDEHFKPMGRYDKAGMHVPSRRALRNWFRNAGFGVERFVDGAPASALGEPEILAVGRKLRRTVPALETPSPRQGQTTDPIARCSG